MTEKRHFKMYKHGKLWVTAVAGIAAITMGTMSVSADEQIQDHDLSNKVALVTEKTNTDVEPLTVTDEKSADVAEKQDDIKGNALEQEAEAKDVTEVLENKAETKDVTDAPADKSETTEVTDEAEEKSEKQDTTDVAEDKTENKPETDLSENKSETKKVTDTPKKSSETKAELEPEQEVKNGWQDGKYFENGNFVTGQKQIDKKWYLFDANGNALTGLQIVGSYTHYYQKDFSQLRDGYLNLGPNEVYYFNINGEAMKGIRKFTDSNGKLQIEAYNHHTYQQMRNAYYEIKSKNITYYFNENGRATKGIRQFTDSKGKLQVEAYNHQTFNQMRNAYYDIKSKNTTYYFNNDGRAMKGIRKFKDSKGKLQVEAYNHQTYKQMRNAYYDIKSKNTTYYFNSNGRAMKGIRTFKDSKGKLQVEAYNHQTYKQMRNAYYDIKNKKTTYYLNNSGRAMKGARYFGNDVEYYGDNYKRLTNTWKTFNNTRYYFGNNGKATQALLNYKYYSQLNQGAPQGCEGASMQMALSHKGRYVPSLQSIYKKTGSGYHVSPNKGFYGNPFGNGGAVTETIFAGAMAKSFKDMGAADLTGAKKGDIIRELNRGNAIVTWADYSWRLTGAHSFHVMTIVGHSNGKFLIADPYSYGHRTQWVDQNTWEYVNTNTQTLGYKSPKSMNMVIR